MAQEREVGLLDSFTDEQRAEGKTMTIQEKAEVVADTQRFIVRTAIEACSILSGTTQHV